MSSTSTHFHLVIASSSDLVAVDSHIANNFSTLDAILAIAHTGTGQIKAGLTFTTPIIQSPVISGTMTGASIVIATAARFNTITATGGLMILSSLTAAGVKIGTYSLPATIGATNQILTVQTGNAVWVANSPGTGANTSLSNLATVILNTGLGTGSGGFFTFARVIATSGALTGLTVFQATTGTFAGNVTVTGTLTANVLKCTGGTITAGTIAVGTYTFPATLGTTGQVLGVTAGPTLAFIPGPGYSLAAYTSFAGTSTATITGLSRATPYILHYHLMVEHGTGLTLAFVNATASGHSYGGFGFMQGFLNTGTGEFLNAMTATAASIQMTTRAARVTGTLRLSRNATDAGGGGANIINYAGDFVSSPGELPESVNYSGYYTLSAGTTLGGVVFVAETHMTGYLLAYAVLTA